MSVRLVALVGAGLLSLPAPMRSQDTTAVRQTAAGILIDFQDVDLRTVITALAEVGGLNVSYGDIPPRRTTLRLHQPIGKAEVLPLLKSVAATNGLQVIQDERILRLQVDDPRTQIPAAKAVVMPESRLFVYRLRHARAAKLASTLQAIFGSTAAQGPPPSSIPPTRTSDRPAALGSDSAKPASMQPSTATVSISATLHAPIQIVSDETTNALVIHAIEPDYEIVRQAIEALDLRPRQVLIEMLIAEVRHSSELDFGVAARSTRETGPDGARGSAIASSSTADLILRLTTNAAFDVNVALHALQSRGDVRILSRPVLLAQNNQEAKILVGSQRPFVQVFRSLPTEAAIRDQVVQYKDVGTSLTILPTINADGYVDLQLAQEVSTATTEVQFGAPVISTRETSTHLLVRNGQTAMLGGLVDRTQEASHSGLPFLAAIPLAGHLFGSAIASRATTELFLFLTPYIIETDSDVDKLREEVERQSKWVRDAKTQTIQPPAKPPLR
ncbi:MAG TPA: secretin N-terminal domain-containing protein [Gemmatimonadaceae bacterium]|jgi:general secretion pathway protein D|nr:secretin N-terminal domain-containing protein [Gemmatimonadaceae bacterium]